MGKKIKEILKPKINLVKGTRFTSFLFLAFSILIAAGILMAANIYYDLDNNRIFTEEEFTVGSSGTVNFQVTTAGNVTVAGNLSVKGSTTLGDQAADQITFYASTLAIPNSLNIDSGTLYIDASNSRVGIGTNSPSQKLDVVGGYARSDTGFCIGNSCITSWAEAGQGDITAVGNITSGEAFTSNTPGQYLYFRGPTQSGKTKLKATDTASDYEVTIPATSGTIALGTGTENYVAYWSGNNTLAGERYLSSSRGGTGIDTSSSSGVPTISSGTWSVNSVLPLSLGGTGASLTAQAGGILYSTNSALAISSAGNSGQLLTSDGTSAPTWSNIADLITVQNGLSESGTTNLTIELGGNLSKNTTISLGNYNLIFNMTGSGDFKIRDNSSDIFVVSHDGKVYYKGTSGYAIAESGKQILREMIPIMGFDLPVQCSTACDDEYAVVSRTIESYPFSNAESGTSRVHKFVIRYATSDTTTQLSFKVSKYESGNWVQYSTFTVPASPGTDLNEGTTYITSDVSIPSDAKWRLEMEGASSLTVRIYQIFLAAYDEIQ